MGLVIRLTVANLGTQIVVHLVSATQQKNRNAELGLAVPVLMVLEHALEHVHLAHHVLPQKLKNAGTVLKA